uniref:cysteine--tRNA ligase n=1 Tax=Mucochytrium quahogii TaxID=96639 RepID=A0A7S2RQQ1_9STRA
MSLCGKGCLGGARENESKGKLQHHPWHPPVVDDEDPLAQGVLMINNSLTGKKERFVPTKGREVRWYTCGPTVYDSTHVGHARTYLTFDIMRRIMSDYFNYDVLYQINITDIDDKIILRARQNKLVADLENDSNVGFEQLVSLVDQAVVEAGEKFVKKTADLNDTLENAKLTKNRKLQEETEEQIKMHLTKEGNFVNETQAIEAAKADPKKDRSALIAAAKSVLSVKLDQEKGDSVTDHGVFNAHARKYEREYMEDMEALGIREPDVLTRVTEYIPQIITFIQRIVDKGLAYESNGSVYLSLDAYKKEHNYRKLSPSNEASTEAELEESEGALGDTNASEKRNPSDFALWKSSKRGEPEWKSPWGMGRPGWHIECSVIASDILGEQLDLHSGGEDLKFPHHDNELAQSEACFGSQQWVNYFTHAGHLHIKGLKMSKSLKNFVTIRQALEKHSARQLRILFLLQPWDEQMNFSDQTVDDAKAKEKTFRVFFQEVESLSRDDYLLGTLGFQMGEHDHKLSTDFLEAQRLVHRSLLDNFDTKAAMNAMLDLIAKSNAYIRLPNAKPAVLLLKRIAMYITRILRVFGVVQGADSFGFGSGQGSSGADSKQQVVTPYVDALVSFREQVRNAALKSGNKKDPAIQAILQACDSVRDTALVHAGVRLEDRPDGSKWNLEDPAVLIQEQADKLEKERDAKISKLEKQKAQLEKELVKAKSGLVSPAEMFKTEEFSAWDDQGLPTMLADGTTELSDGQRKKKKKVQDKQAKIHTALMTKADGNPQAYLAKIEADIKQVETDIDKFNEN